MSNKRTRSPVQKSYELRKDSDVVDVKIPKGFIFLATAQNIVDPDVKDTIVYARSRGINERDFWRFS